MGQTFLQIPVARTNNAGATGIKIFQNNKTPSDGKNNRQNKIKAPSNHTTACAKRQLKTEREDNWSPDLKSNSFTDIGTLVTLWANYLQKGKLNKSHSSKDDSPHSLM